MAGLRLTADWGPPVLVLRHPLLVLLLLLLLPLLPLLHGHRVCLDVRHRHSGGLRDLLERGTSVLRLRHRVWNQRLGELEEGRLLRGPAARIRHRKEREVGRLVAVAAKGRR